jgi:hypothetical protein
MKAALLSVMGLLVLSSASANAGVMNYSANTSEAGCPQVSKVSVETLAGGYGAKSISVMTTVGSVSSSDVSTQMHNNSDIQSYRVDSIYSPTASVSLERNSNRVYMADGYEEYPGHSSMNIILTPKIGNEIQVISCDYSLTPMK